MFPNWCFITNLAWHDGGRIIVAWRTMDVHVDVLSCPRQFILVALAPNNGDSFLCTFVYGSTMKQDRLQLFSVLQEMSKSINSPWILLGDFN